MAHIYFLIGLKNQFIVAFTWPWDYITFHRGARLITGFFEGRSYSPRASRRAPARRLSAARHRWRFSLSWAIAISAAGVTISVSTVAKPRPKTMAVERWIHHCVDGAPIVISRVEELEVDAEGDRQHAEDGGHRGQHHRPRALAAGLQDRLIGGASLRSRSRS